MITQSILKEYLHYNTDTGLFTWIKKPSKKILIGIEAGYLCNNTGYLYIKIQHKPYSSHRLAWLYVHGSFPAEQIDHLNHDRTDNRIVNLRSVSHIDNGRNQSMKSNNTSGFNGVSWDKRRDNWQVRISVNGKETYLGSFKKIEDAISARQAANVKYSYHSNHGL